MLALPTVDTKANAPVEFSTLRVCDSTDMVSIVAFFAAIKQ